MRDIGQSPGVASPGRIGGLLVAEGWTRESPAIPRQLSISREYGVL